MDRADINKISKKFIKKIDESPVQNVIRKVLVKAILKNEKFTIIKTIGEKNFNYFVVMECEIAEKFAAKGHDLFLLIRKKEAKSLKNLKNTILK